MDQVKEQRALDMIGAQLNSAVNPIVLCSFGKDSIVLLHLCLRFRKVPVIFLRFAKFHEKHQHAMNVMQLWDLEVYDLWPRTSTDYQRGTFFEVLHGYHLGHDAQGRPGTLFLFSGIRARQDRETRYLCANDDLLWRPKSYGHDYRWDVTFLGHKGTDDPELGSTGAIVNPVSDLGATRLVVPFTDWTDDDIWAYIRQYDLPYDRARYDDRDESVSPDKYPTCFQCRDAQSVGKMVDCPKYQVSIASMARPEGEHAQFRQALIESVQYCQVSGEPRSTPNEAHL